jgi:hypothetical protein
LRREEDRQRRWQNDLSADGYGLFLRNPME